VLELPDGRLIGYAEFGGPTGWPVFFFHGLPGSRLSGRLTDADALALGARVIALDRPGYGLSDDQPRRRLIDWPTDVANCADRLGIKQFAVAGISGGGPYAVACAALLPARVRAAAIISGLAPPDVPGLAGGSSAQNRLLSALARRSPWLVRPLLGLISLMARRAPGLSRRQMAKSGPDRTILADPAVANLFLADVREAFRHGSSGAAYEAWLLTQPWGFDLAAITVPVFIWQGEADVNVPPAMGHYLASAIPGARATFVPGAGHLVGVTRSREILEQLRPRD
jgi:pimeloyl-ACP methyl ester carboxylesterase